MSTHALQLIKPGVVRDVDADVLELVCEGCGNEKSCVVRDDGKGLCAYCLNERVRALATRYRNRYRRQGR